MANTWVISGNTEVNNLNGGGWDHGNYADVTFSDVHDGNGGPTSTDAAWNADNPSLFYNCELTDNGGNTKITETSGNTFANVVDGTYANIEFERNYLDGWYVVEKIDNDSINIVNNPYVSNSGANVKVGGFFASPAHPHDSGLVAAGDYIKIEGGYTYTLEETWVIDSGIGTAANRITVEGVDSSGVRLDVSNTLPIITTDIALADGLIKVFANMEYYNWWFLDFDGGGAGKATYSFNQYTVDNHFATFHYCLFHNSSSHAFFGYTSYNGFFNCEFYDAGKGGATGDGMYWYGSFNGINGCSFHDNLDSGVYTYGTNVVWNNCIFYNNTEQGLEFSVGADTSKVFNCIFYNNTLSGFLGASGLDTIMIYNCSSLANGAYGYNMVTTPICHFLGYNHSYNNTSGHCSLATTDALWEVFADGSNITGDPLFTDAANGDFSLQVGSPLSDAGAPQYFADNGDLDANQNYPDIGAFSPKECTPKYLISYKT